MEHIIGTSGYSFGDWVGPFYPPGTPPEAMYDYYARHFAAVELNFTYYRMPTQAMMAKFAHIAPDRFRFWVKANQETTHKHNRAAAAAFIDGLLPLTESGKLAGVLLQFPQSFHRTVANRKYLAATLEDLSLSGLTGVSRAEPAAPLVAVEFRHRSWAAPAAVDGLSQRGAVLVVPDVPDLPGLYHSPPAATGPVGYLRLHSRNPDYWYAGGAKRYDYNYSDLELTELAAAWSDPALGLTTLYTFFNNCHRGQAADNADRFAQIVSRIAAER